LYLSDQARQGRGIGRVGAGGGRLELETGFFVILLVVQGLGQGQGFFGVLQILRGKLQGVSFLSFNDKCLYGKDFFFGQRARRIGPVAAAVRSCRYLSVLSMVVSTPSTGSSTGSGVVSQLKTRKTASKRTFE
jgi:hypothetical protein